MADRREAEAHRLHLLHVGGATSGADRADRDVIGREVRQLVDPEHGAPEQRRRATSPIPILRERDQLVLAAIAEEIRDFLREDVGSENDEWLDVAHENSRG